MPNTAAISINDGTAAVVFSPDSVSSTHVVMQNLAVAALDKRELLHYDRPAQSKGDVRRTIRVQTPIVVGTDAQGKEIIKMITFRGEEISPVEATGAQRLRVRTLASNGLVHASTVAVFDNPEWFW